MLGSEPGPFLPPEPLLPKHPRPTPAGSTHWRSRYSSDSWFSKLGLVVQGITQRKLNVDIFLDEAP